MPDLGQSGRPTDLAVWPISPRSSVWKFEIPVQDEFAVEMPTLARVLHVAVQNDKPCMWALVNPANKRVERTFYVHTGHPVRPEMVHLGTFILFGGTFVGHLFEHAAERFIDAKS